jgi:hypothetical protein
MLIASVVISCNDKFETGADYKDITAVYSLLSMRDSVTYVKINKGFFSETENNLMLAQNEDSIYYNNIEVKIEELSNGNVVNSYKLDKVDLVKEGYVKEGGTFLTSPNYAYKMKLNKILDPTKLHHLVIKNLTTGQIIDATTTVIDDTKFNMQAPKNNKDRISFFDPLQSTNFLWSSPEGASFYDLYIRFFYEEKNVVTGVITRGYKDLAIARNIESTGGSSTSALVRMETFYGALNGAFPIDQNLVRYVDTPDIIVQAGGQELKTYIDVTSAQGGITADQIKPVYTNLRSDGIAKKDVFGIFSSKATEYAFQIPFDGKTVDSILNGNSTQNLNFIGVTSQ